MRLELIPWPGPDVPIASTLRERLEHDGFSVFQWTDDPRAHYSPHSHDHDESIWVVSGEITFGAGNRQLRLRPGDRLMLPRGSMRRSPGRRRSWRLPAPKVISPETTQMLSSWSCECGE